MSLSDGLYKDQTRQIHPAELDASQRMILTCQWPRRRSESVVALRLARDADEFCGGAKGGELVSRGP